VPVLGASKVVNSLNYLHNLAFWLSAFESWRPSHYKSLICRCFGRERILPPAETPALGPDADICADLPGSAKCHRQHATKLACRWKT
jgi:hypothetical protein